MERRGVGSVSFNVDLYLGQVGGSVADALRELLQSNQSVPGPAPMPVATAEDDTSSAAFIRYLRSLVEGPLCARPKNSSADTRLNASILPHRRQNSFTSGGRKVTTFAVAV